MKPEVSLPFISSKPLRQFTMPEFHRYVKSLRSTYMAKQTKLKVERATKTRARKPPVQDWNFRRNHKGTPIISMRNRNPKYLTTIEFKELLIVSGMTQQDAWNWLHSKKPPIYVTDKPVSQRPNQRKKS